MLGTRENYWGFRVRQNLIWGGEEASTGERAFVFN